jgi:penicillin-binding protein 1A
MRIVATMLIWLSGLILIGVALVALYVLVIWLRLPDVATLGASGDPGVTAFMGEDGCREHARSFRALDEIDPIVACTFVWAEDWRFFRHSGIDKNALKWAIAQNWRERAWRYGASTIPMQLARNLFLSRRRTPSRKAIEMVLARRLGAGYERRRLLELYLNSTELAPCVYGVDAAAQHYFGHGAELMDAAEASFLAAMLPRPQHPPGSRSNDRRQLVDRQQQLISHLARAGLMSRGQTRVARAQVVAGWRDGWMGHRPAVSKSAPLSWYEHGCGTRPSPKKK